MSAVFSDAEESLGTGLERQMNNLAGESFLDASKSS
jgi:hypothetical protein